MMNTRWWNWKRGCGGLVLLLALTGSVNAGSLKLISTLDPAQRPVGGNGDSSLPLLNADGGVILFASSANNLVLNQISNPIPVALPVRLNVYQRDRTNGTTTLVSVDPTGVCGGDGDSLPTAISADGRYALFESDASNLVVGDTNQATDIFVRDLVSNVTVLVSINTNGLPANGTSRSSVMTPDGRFVAFVSEASDLVPGDTNQISDVFVRDLKAGTTTLVSAGAVATNFTKFSYGSEVPAITPDGRYVVFRSVATNLVPGVRAVGDVYLRDLALGSTVWVSRGARAAVQSTLGPANAVSFNPSVSDDGQWVAFEAAAAGASAGVVLRYQVMSDTTTIVHTNANILTGSYDNLWNLVMTPDGRFLAFVANTNGTSGMTTCLLVWDGQSGKTTLASGNLSGSVPAQSFCDSPCLDAAGRWVVFRSDASGLVGTTTGVHLYARDLIANTTLLLDTDTNGLPAIGDGEASAATPCLSTDGRWVAFEYPDANLAANDLNRCYDVFVRSLAAGTPELVSAHHPDLGSLAGDGHSTLTPASLSYDGRYLAFASEADNLVPNDTNSYRDVFLHDQVFHTNFLVSVATNGAVSDGLSFEPSLSADGRYVTFTSSADNLVTNDTNNSQDVFVRDMLLGTTTLVSMRTNGPGPGNAAAYSPVLSRDGRYVLFRSRATNLAPGVSSGGSENAFLRDLSAKVTYLLTSKGCISASISLDGRFVAVVERSEDINPGKAYLWDSTVARCVMTNTAYNFTQVAVNSNGNRLAFTTVATPNLYSVLVMDQLTKTSWIAATNTSSLDGVRWSPDSQFLVFTTKISQTNQVYLYDCTTRTKQLLSTSLGTASRAYGHSDSPDISADNRFIAYRSAAADIVPNDINSATDIFLYDRVNHTTTLVTSSLYGNRSADSFSRQPLFSGDGQHLAFQSYASDLVTQDFNSSSDVYMLDLFGSSPMPWFVVSATRGANPGENPTLSWPVAPGKNYRVQYRELLSDPEWRDLNGMVVIVGTQGYFKDPSAVAGQRFYRIVAY